MARSGRKITVASVTATTAANADAPAVNFREITGHSARPVGLNL
jgi:hypothetical protein